MEIRRPKHEDINKLTPFFERVILDTFIKEGIGDKHSDIIAEMEEKKKYLKSDFDSNGKNRFFLIALDGNRIIGSIEYGPASDLIIQYTNEALKDLVEIGTVFVHPDYQRKGLGNSLLHEMYETLQKKGRFLFR